MHSDCGIFGLEARKVSQKAWGFLVHETEAVWLGGYVPRRITDDSITVSREEDGEVHVLFDVCRHRGMRLCRSEAGNASRFRCPYRGYAYKNAGKPNGVPFEEAYREQGSTAGRYRGDHRLRRRPRRARPRQGVRPAVRADGGPRAAPPGTPRLRARPAVEERRRLMRVALGEENADLFVRGGTVVNVYSGELVRANVAVLGERIAYVGPSEGALGPDTEVVDARGLYVAPGWIEPHSHAYLYYNPESLAEAILPGGTTTVVSDELFFSLLGGAKTSRAVMDECARLPVRFLWYARPEPASPVDDGSENHFHRERLVEVLDHPLVLGVGEAGAWARFLQDEDAPLGPAIVEANRRGLIADGHTTGARDDKLAALVAAGLRSCHEAITAEEALERLRLGLWTPLRHSSLRPDLPELLRLLTEKEIDTRRVLLTTDGPAPDAIAERGYLDGLLRLAVQAGVPPIRAIQMATVNPATYLQLDDQLGGIAPGRLADLVLLPDLSSFRPRLVVAGGRAVARGGEPVEPMPGIDWSPFGLEPGFRQGPWIEDPKLYDARPGEDLPVIGFVSDVITRLEEPPPQGGLPEGYLRAVHLTRDGRWVSRALVRGFADDLDGFATTATSSGHLLVFGRRAEDMALAASRARALRGGMASASGGRVLWEAALPLAGIMTPDPFENAHAVAKGLKARLRSAGYPFSDPLYSLLFLTADFLPGPRLTWSGVLDARKGKLIHEAEPLGG